MGLVEDLDVFFNADEFGVEAIWSGSADPVVVIFDKAYIENLGITGSLPVALAKEVDFPGVDEGQTLTINGDDYTIIRAEADGTGVVRLIMEIAGG